MLNNTRSDAPEGASTVVGAWRGVLAQPGRVVARIRSNWARALRHPGYERDALLKVAKSILAASLAWTLLEIVLNNPASTFAPFSALLVVQATVYRSIIDSSRYIVAVTLGIIAAGALGVLLGNYVWTFALVLTIAMLLSRSRYFGSHYVQLPVAAVFALGGGYATQTGTVFSLLESALIGAGVGLLVNIVLAPPMRFTNAGTAVRDLSVTLYELLSDMSAGLHDNEYGDHAAEWRHRARRCLTTAENARYAVEHSAESVRWNPWRLFQRNTPSLEGYRVAAASLGRATRQTHSIAGGIEEAADKELDFPLPESFLVSYGQLLNVVASTAGYFGEREDDASVDDPGTLTRCINDGRRQLRELREYVERHDLERPGQWPSYETLLTDAERLLEEFGRQQPQASVPASRETRPR